MSVLDCKKRRLFIASRNSPKRPGSPTPTAASAADTVWPARALILERSAAGNLRSADLSFRAQGERETINRDVGTPLDPFRALLLPSAPRPPCSKRTSPLPRHSHHSQTRTTPSRAHRNAPEVSVHDMMAAIRSKLARRRSGHAPPLGTGATVSVPVARVPGDDNPPDDFR